jgi:hypothetical protein
MDKVSRLRLIDRARQLADSGSFPNWREIAEALAEEGYPNPVRNLSTDDAIRQMLDLRCEQARRERT